MVIMNKKKINASFLLLIIVPLIVICALAIYSVTKSGAFINISDDKTDGGEKTDIPDDSEKPIGKTEIDSKNKTEEPPLPQVPEKKYRKITFAAAGDILVHTNVYKYASQLAADSDAEYDFKPMFANIKEIISSADIAYVNQETPCAGKERGYSGYPTFNTPDEIADAVIDAGFDIVNIANNHMLDKGESGHSRNIDFWSEKPEITLLGGFKNEEDYNTVRVIEQEGVKIAFLSYTYGTNGMVLPASSELVVPYSDADEIDRQTKEARELADVVIVSMHWGYEDNFAPNEEQKNLARIMADNGVDVILGMHSHVLQPIEWLDRPDGGKTLCIYSLGNLISTMMYGRNMLGGIITFEINENDDGFVIENAELIPIMTYYQSGFSSPTIYLYKNFTADMEKNHGAHRYDSRMSQSYLDNIIKTTIDRSFIKDEYYDEIYGDAESKYEISNSDTENAAA